MAAVPATMQLRRMRPVRRARVRAWACGLLAALVAVAQPLAASEREARAALVGRAAPDFAQRLLGEGGNFRLSEHRGDVVLLGFWTSWCGACRAHVERLQRLAETYGNAGLVVVGVSLDDDPARATDLLRVTNASFRNVHDARRELGALYRVNDVPMTVLVDRAGAVRHVQGELARRDEPALLDRIRTLLDE